MKYAIISVEKTSYCLYCKTPHCWQCIKYNTYDKIIKIISTAYSYNQILSDFEKLDKSHKNTKYQIRQITRISPSDTRFEPDSLYAVLETVYLIQNKTIKYNEIINYDFSLQPILNTYQNIITGKIKPTSHFEFVPFVHWATWNIVKLSKKLPTFIEA